MHLKLRAKAKYVEAPMVLNDAMECLLYADAKNCVLLKETVMEFLLKHKDEGIEKILFNDAPGYLMKDLLAAVAIRDKKKDVNCRDAQDCGTMSDAKD